MTKPSPEVLARDNAFIEALVTLGYQTETRISLLETSATVLDDKAATLALWDKCHEEKPAKDVGDGYKQLWVQCCFRSVLSQPAYKGVKELFEIAAKHPEMTVEEIHAAHAEAHPADPVEELAPAKKSAKNPPPASAPVEQQPTSRGVRKKAPTPAKTPKGDDTMATKKTSKKAAANPAKAAKKSTTKAAPKTNGKKREKGEETPVVANVLKMMGRAKGATMAELVEGNTDAKPRYLSALIHRILKGKGYKISKEREGKTVHYFVK